jgi:hypothetical protein
MQSFELYSRANVSPMNQEQFHHNKGNYSKYHEAVESALEEGCNPLRNPYPRIHQIVGELASRRYDYMKMNPKECCRTFSSY